MADMSKARRVHATLEKTGAYKAIVYADGHADWTFVEDAATVKARKELGRLKTGQVRLKHLNAIVRNHGLWLFRGDGRYFYQRADAGDCSMKIPAPEMVDSIGLLDGKTWLRRLDDALIRWYASEDRVAATILRAQYGF